MRRLALAIALAAALAAAGCTPAAPPGGTVTASPASPAAHAAYPASWVLPDPKLTPGAVQPGYALRDICPHVSPALEAMRPSASQTALVYKAYGITHRVAGQYEIDHVIPVELLGLVAASASGPALNLYPEVNDTPDPAMLRKYHLNAAYVHNSKDILEDVLHRDVCAGKVPLAAAQQAIRTDWRAAYARYVGPPPA
ncbi:MAG TPA: hypothetical protein VNH17_06885 [Streptosporangiaceae bacterium]|nr:hypothetical protein [Streptosporangiaceae bacterium]